MWLDAVVVEEGPGDGCEPFSRVNICSCVASYRRVNTRVERVPRCAIIRRYHLDDPDRVHDSTLHWFLPKKSAIRYLFTLHEPLHLSDYRFDYSVKQWFHINLERRTMEIILGFCLVSPQFSTPIPHLECLTSSTLTLALIGLFNFS